MSLDQDPHRKQVKHYHEPGDFHELTFSTYQRKPLLTNDRWNGWLAERLDVACRKQRFQLVAFVFMLEHVHLLVLPESQDPKAIGRFLAAVKRPVSVQVKAALQKASSPLLETLTIQERPGKKVFRFWQEGSGYDRNLNKEKTVLSSIDYIHENPVRRGICEKPIDWKWSSARWYASDGQESDSDLPTIHGLPTGFFV